MRATRTKSPKGKPKKLDHNAKQRPWLPLSCPPPSSGLRGLRECSRAAKGGARDRETEIASVSPEQKGEKVETGRDRLRKGRVNADEMGESRESNAIFMCSLAFVYIYTNANLHL